MGSYGTVFLIALGLGFLGALSYLYMLRGARRACQQNWKALAEELGLNYVGSANEFPRIEGIFEGVPLEIAIEREYVGYFSYNDTVLRAELPPSVPPIEMETRQTADTWKRKAEEPFDDEFDKHFHFATPPQLKAKSWLIAQKEKVLFFLPRVRGLLISGQKISITLRGIQTEQGVLRPRIEELALFVKELERGEDPDED